MLDSVNCVITSFARVFVFRIFYCVCCCRCGVRTRTYLRVSGSCRVALRSVPQGKRGVGGVCKAARCAEATVLVGQIANKRVGSGQ